MDDTAATQRMILLLHYCYTADDSAVAVVSYQRIDSSVYTVDDTVATQRVVLLLHTE